MDTYLEIDCIIHYRSLHRIDLREEIPCILVEVGDTIGIRIFRVIDTVA